MPILMKLLRVTLKDWGPSYTVEGRSGRPERYQTSAAGARLTAVTAEREARARRPAPPTDDVRVSDDEFSALE